MNTLSISEKLLILAHHTDRARFRISEIHVKYGLIGALLLEMAVEEKIAIENNKLILKDTGKQSDPILEELTVKLKSHGIPRNIRFWIKRLAQKSTRFKWELFYGLEQKKVVRLEHMKLLGVIPYKRSYLINKKLQYDLIKETRNSIMQQGALNAEQLVILGLVKACKLDKILCRERGERKIINQRLKAIMKSSPIAEGVDLTIRQVQAAIIGAVAASGAGASAAAR